MVVQLNSEGDDGTGGERRQAVLAQTFRMVCADRQRRVLWIPNAAFLITFILPSEGIIMVRLMQLGFAAAALVMAAVSLAGSPARAFTFESLGGNSSGGATLADPDDQVKNFGNNGASLLGPNGPTVQFNAGRGLVSPFSPFQGFSPGPPPPQAYGPRSLGNND